MGIPVFKTGGWSRWASSGGFDSHPLPPCQLLMVNYQLSMKIMCDTCLFLLIYALELFHRLHSAQFTQFTANTLPIPWKTADRITASPPLPDDIHHHQRIVFVVPVILRIIGADRVDYNDPHKLDHKIKYAKVCWWGKIISWRIYYVNKKKESQHLLNISWICLDDYNE